MRILLVYGTGYDWTHFGYNTDGQISVFPDMRPRSDKARLMKGCSGWLPVDGVAPRNAPIAVEPTD